MDSNQLRCLFKNVMLEFFDSDLCFSGYRHVTQAFSEKHLTNWVPELPMELQAGHSVETGRQMYARSTEDFLYVNRDDIISFRKMSINWQHLLGLSKGIALEVDHPKSLLENESSKGLDHKGMLQIIRSTYSKVDQDQITQSEATYILADPSKQKYVKRMNALMSESDGSSCKRSFLNNCLNEK